jgi:hypothetical protein
MMVTVQREIESCCTAITEEQDTGCVVSASRYPCKQEVTDICLVVLFFKLT